jgi:choice-of-anchor C domain-containing protein
MQRLLFGSILWLLLSAHAAASALDGDWFIVTGRNTLWTSDAEHDASQAIGEWLKQDNVALLFLSFTARGGYVAQFEDGVAWAGPIDSYMKKTAELGKRQTGVKCLAHWPQGGWALVDSRNQLAADGIPAGTLAKLQKAVRSGGKVRSLAFSPDGGWVVVFDRGIQQDGLPENLSKLLADHVKKGAFVRCVAFTSQGDWFVIDGQNNSFSSNTNHAAFKELQRLKQQGQVIEWVAFSPGEFAQGYVLERRPVRSVKITTSIELNEPDGKAREWALYATQFPEMDRQRDVKATLEPGGAPAREAGPAKRPVLFMHLIDKPNGFKASLTAELTLYATQLLPRVRGQQVPPVADLTAEQVQRYTAAWGPEDYDAKVFQDYLDRTGLRRDEKESDLSFARRAFYYLKHHIEYADLPEGLTCKASDICTAGKGICTEQEVLLVAILRANHIPARALPGGLVPWDKPAVDGFLAGHVRSEFFARGIGWVPADLTFESDGELSYFGYDDGLLAVNHNDFDFIFEPFPGESYRLGALAYFAWWPLGSSREGEQVVIPVHTDVTTLPESPWSAAARAKPPRAPSRAHPLIPTVQPAPPVQLVNGGFEEGPDAGSSIDVGKGMAGPAGWTVTQGHISYVGTKWRAAQGARSILLAGAGDSAARIVQSLPTMKGEKYRVTFRIAGAPKTVAGEVGVQSVVLTAANQSQTFTFDTTGKTTTNMGWEEKSWEFEALAGETSLEFSAAPSRNPKGGPAIDDVHVVAVAAHK